MSFVTHKNVDSCGGGFPRCKGVSGDLRSIPAAEGVEHEAEHAGDRGGDLSGRHETQRIPGFQSGEIRGIRA